MATRTENGVGHAAVFANIARKIGDPQLENGLRELSEEVELAVHHAKLRPKRAAVRADALKALYHIKQAQRLMNKHQRYTVALGVLSGVYGLEDAARACEGALSSIPEKGAPPKKAGMHTCAMIIVEAWRLVHGKAPGQNNEKVQEICAEYWKACGGAVTGDVGLWRRHLTAARNPNANHIEKTRYIYVHILRHGSVEAGLDEECT